MSVGNLSLNQLCKALNMSKDIVSIDFWGDAYVAIQENEHAPIKHIPIRLFYDLSLSFFPKHSDDPVDRIRNNWLINRIVDLHDLADKKIGESGCLTKLIHMIVEWIKYFFHGCSSFDISEIEYRSIALFHSFDIYFSKNEISEREIYQNFVEYYTPYRQDESAVYYTRQQIDIIFPQMV